MNTNERRTDSCPSCGGSVYRSSTPTIDEHGVKRFWRHVDTGFAACDNNGLASAAPTA